MPKNYSKPDFVLLYPDDKEILLTSETLSILMSEQPDQILRFQTVLKNLNSASFPDHMKYLRQLGWIHSDQSCDKGHFMFYPKGAIVYQLIANWLKKISESIFQALPIRTPMLYDWSRPDIQGQAGIFNQRLYKAKGPDSDKEFVLRFNGDAGLFQIIKDSRLTHHHLPLRIYEQGPNFRYSQSGELSGIRRARVFSLLDMHSFCTDINQGFQEYEDIFIMQCQILKDLKIEFVILFKTNQEFYPQAKKYILKILSKFQQPVLVEIDPSQKQYWIMKHIVFTHHPQKIFHVQLDIEDSHRYGIHYQNSENLQSECTIIHSALGSVEKWILIFLEDALKKKRPTLPIWLAPTQVRFIPVDNVKHISFCEDLLQIVRSLGYRADIDERQYSLGHRIRNAEQDWVPYTIVCGDKESSSDSLPIRIRCNSLTTMSIQALIELLNHETSDMPKRPLANIYLSRQPAFQGQK